MSKVLSRLPLLLVFPLLIFAFAQEQESEETTSERIITIDYSGGTQRSADLRYGPIVYEHPEPEGIVGSVSNLTIYSQHAELRAPEGVLIAEAVGQREATFTGNADGVRVTRERLTATGPVLEYSEATGLGVLQGPVAIVIAPEDESDEPVEISANEVTFQVDTDVSISRGDVKLVNGKQSATAEELVYEEERGLARMSSEGEQVTATRVDENGDVLVITADVIRALTDADMLLATGNVTIQDGDIISTGHTVFFDDEANRALIIGDPAVSVDEANSTRTSGNVLEQFTDLDVVRVYSDPVDFDEQIFMLTSEQGSQ